MIDHERYRLLIVADPHNPDPELREHRDGCQECSLFTERLLRFESRLERALRVQVSTDTNVLPFAGKTASRRPSRRWRAMALAASVMLAVIVAGGIWLALPSRSLAAAVVAHMAGEPDAWRRSTLAVPGAALNAVLGDSKLRLAPEAGLVTYASSCFFRGHQVPHLVVQTDSGPVTVMVLVHESVSRPVQFDEQGYRGTIVPVTGHGSIAVLMRGPKADANDVERIAAQVQKAIVWTP
jgi:Protein of unknown function (DUF3379)